MADDEPLPESYSLTVGEEKKETSQGFTGKGTAVYTSGDTYEGLYANGERQGQGRYTYRGGDFFEGCFDKNLKSGLGRVTYKNGAFYHGYFKSGVREGEGTFRYANGDIYSGSWSGGTKQGKGTYVYAKTKYSYEGDWKEGQIVSGTWSLTDGTKYVGGFSAQKPEGDGVWHTAKGTMVEGAYTQQVLPIDATDVVPKGEKPDMETKIFWTTSSLKASEGDDV